MMKTSERRLSGDQCMSSSSNNIIISNIYDEDDKSILCKHYDCTNSLPLPKDIDKTLYDNLINSVWFCSDQCAIYYNEIT